MSIMDTLAARHGTHGSFTEGAAVSQAICKTLRGGANWGGLDATQREAIEMIAHKMARIVSGNPDFADHWHDIMGYARLAEELCSNYVGAANAK